MATIELNATHSLTASLGGQKATARDFLVDLPYQTVAALINSNSPVPGVPKRGDNHPYLSGLYCQNHGVEPVEDGIHTVVTAFYATSNLSRLQYAEPDITGSNWVRGVTFQRVVIDIPFAVKVPYTYAGANGAQITKDGWVVRTKKLRETRVVFEARWRILNPSLSGSIEAFYAQDDKVHEIHGRKYVFNVGNITPMDNTFYEVSAQWMLDAGTRIPTLWTGSSNLRLPRANTNGMIFESNVPATGFIRDPFKHLTTVVASDPNGSGDTAVPRCTQIPDYEEALSGWQSLPSIPNL